MTGFLHYRWKKRTVFEGASQEIGIGLDIASGTGDIAFELSRSNNVTQVIALDFALPMLKLAQTRITQAHGAPNVELQLADALSLPFTDNSLTRVTTGFSLRNVTSVCDLFSETYRVLKPNGTFAILEATPLKSTRWNKVFSWAFRFYFHHVVPLLGSVLANDREAYTYLPRSVDNFYTPAELVSMLQNTGFSRVRYISVGFGTTSILIATKI
jgi:demethylmenaquinone methyltransferase/2-methoxy-6-polyprenyl-1,4-benzoquinol methylase